MQPEVISPDHSVRLLRAQVFHGPNPCALAQVVVCELKVTKPSVPAQDVWHVLKAACPSWVLREPAFRADTPETEDGTHLLAHWVMELALAALNEVRGCVREGGARPLGQGQFLIWVGFHHPQVTLTAIRLATSWVALACRETLLFPQATMTSELDKLSMACRRWHPDYQARILMVAARAKHVPFLPFGTGDDRMWQFGWGKRSRVFFETRSNEDGLLGHQITKYKVASKAFLRGLGFPVAAQVLVTRAEELPGAATAIGWPCVAKPVDRGGGQGVTAGIRDLADLELAFAHARRFTQGPVMVEAFIEGDDHRLMVVDGRLVAAVRRDPPSVVGDGERSVRKLIAELNQGRGANLVTSNYGRAVKIDDVVLACLRQQGLDLDGVPSAGQRIRVRSNSNLSTGGSSTDVTAQVHPAIKRLAEAIATSLGLATCGVDYITTDISRPWRNKGDAVIEVNTTPGMGAIVAAGVDELQVGTQVLGSLPGRLPVVLLVAPESQQKAWLPGLMAEAARRPGWAWRCAGESGVGDLPVGPTGQPLHGCVAMLLRNRLTDSLLVACTSAELQKEGVPVDRVDRVLLCQQDFPAPWMGVLGKVAPSVLRMDDPAAALASCLPS